MLPNTNIIVRPQRNEPDILSGQEHLPLTILDLTDNVVVVIPAPSNGWNIEMLESVDCDEAAPFGWNAYLGDRWIGSSEL